MDIKHYLKIAKEETKAAFSNNKWLLLCKKYIMQKKIYAAHRDLLNGLSPSTVCEKYGFGDYSSFYRLYRKTFNASPNKKTTAQETDQ